MKPLLFVFASIVTLSGCAASGQQTSAPNAFWPQSNGDNAALAAFQGGIIDPQISASLSRADRARALEAEYRALELDSAGKVITWQGKKDGVGGEVYAGQSYIVGSQHCRQLRHTVNQAGASTASLGTACRDENGNWTPLG